MALTDSRMNASEKDLPVITYHFFMSVVESFAFWHAIQFTFSRGFQIRDPFINAAFEKIRIFPKTAVYRLGQ